MYPPKARVGITRFIEDSGRDSSNGGDSTRGKRRCSDSREFERILHAAQLTDTAGRFGMNRRDVLAGTVGFGLAAAGAARSVAAGDTRSPGRLRRNILLIIADDQGYDLSCCEGRVKTPILDELVAEGTLFTQGYATVSSCSSSRSVLYTGLYSHSNGMYGLAHDVHNQSLLDWVVTVPRLMNAAGYATALVGKKHIRPEKALPYDAELVPEKPGIRDVAAMATAVGSFIRAQAAKPF